MSEPSARRAASLPARQPPTRAGSARSAPTRPAPPVRPAQLPELIDISGVAGHLGVSVRHIRRLVAQRRIPYVKWGNLLRFDPNAIAIWLADRSVEHRTQGRRGRHAG